MLKRGDKGSEVKKLQQTIMDLGYPMPRWGADGELGAEALGALARLLTDHGKKFDDDDNTVTEAELAFVYALRDAQKKPLPPPVAADLFFDLRAVSSRKNIGGQRTWKQVTGICLHQTACVIGENPDRWAGTGKWEGQGVGAHLGVTRGGKVIWSHDFERVVWHGNGWNNSTVGIEMDGYYAGIEGDLKTFWRPSDAPNRLPQAPTQALIDSTSATIRWICAEVARHGGKVAQLVAHRQSSKDRQSDPGSALWQAVALPCSKELGLNDGGKGYKIGTGFPIPEAWDSRYAGVKY